MTNCVRDVKLSLFDQFVHTPYLARSKGAILACEHQFPNNDEMPGLRELLFALDHHDLWPSASLEGCCRPVWSMLEDECKWNTTVFIQRFIIDRMRSIVPFETLVYMAQLLPMLLVGKTTCQVTSCVCREETFLSVDPMRRQTLVATDFDGTYGCKVDPLPPLEPTLCISERTWGEFTKDIKNVMQRMPVYIRGTGKSGDTLASATFKAAMIKQFGVTHFLENDTQQIEMLQQMCPDLVICKVI